MVPEARPGGQGRRGEAFCARFPAFLMSITLRNPQEWNIYGMRSIGVIFLLGLLACPAGASGAEAIEWRSDRPLSWDDFEAAVPRNAEAVRVASTASSLAWSYAYEIEWSQRGCSYSIVKLDSVARFLPDRSWVRPGHRTDEILEHEQGHFDIAQIYNEQFKAATRNLVGSAMKCNGQSERKAARLVESEIARLVGGTYEEVWRQYQLRQESYDSETRHGIDREAQSRWTRTIAQSLQVSD